MPATVVVPIPSGDPTGVTDSDNIDAAIAAAGDKGKIVLDTGNYLLARTASVLAPTRFTIEGQGAGFNGRTSRIPGGTILSCGTSFAGGEIIGFQDGTCGPSVLGVSILGDVNMPANVDGIVCHANVNALNLEEVSMAFTTGHGVAWFQGAGGTDGDACKMKTVMLQNCGLNAVHRWPSDSTLIDVHTQYAGTLAIGHGFFSTPGSGGNTCMIGCRADLSSGNGWFLDHNGGFCDAIKLTGCSTERNAQSGVLVTNTSPSGTDYRVPVIISGCCFEGDGHNNGAGGEFAGIQVQGRNRVHISGSNVMCNNKDCANVAPKYGLLVNQAGSAPGKPELIEWEGGYLNFSLGQGGEAVHNPNIPLSLRFGTTVTQGGGYQTSTTNERSGQASTSGRIKTVSSPWVRGTSRILLTATNGANLSVTAGTGSFTVQSDIDCTFNWLIV